MVLRRFNQPYVIAYLVGGVLLGPHGLRLFTHEATLARMGEEFGEDRIEAIETLWNEIDTAFHGLGEASDGVH